ncbi:hypothetical protein BDM02DRAFT_2421493 [Thelephora ganbajun]|uniref:Uncharacterized protein n=1 Tax=Thelephora ganbajun TaxID=370292 RepID=A0ACB6ZTQ9_THEGA|nr:hypothetical protein BDM02DRAFT_2421493 [Thelephora ganbajun]
MDAPNGAWTVVYVYAWEDGMSMNLVSGNRSPLWFGFIHARRFTRPPKLLYKYRDAVNKQSPGYPTFRGSPNESDMTSMKETRRATVRRLKSVVTMCFISLLHLKTPHDGCPSQYNHKARMSGSFDSRRTSRMSGSFDSQRMSKVYGNFDSPRISKVYGGYESRRASRLICECRGY